MFFYGMCMMCIGAAITAAFDKQRLKAGIFTVCLIAFAVGFAVTP